jgi:uncharacterized membrane protein YeaQ/YmgE (transglycosylase-associated protein family)
MLMHLIWLLVVGTIAGWLAAKFMRGRGFGLAGDLIVGIVGSLIGGFIFGLLQISPTGLVGSIVSAFVGAVALLYLVRLLK